MSAEAPKPVDPNPTAEVAEIEGEAAEELAKKEFSTWIPYIASKGIESKQILYTLAKKNNNNNAPVVVQDPYFIAMKGTELQPFLNNNSDNKTANFKPVVEDLEEKNEINNKYKDDFYYTAPRGVLNTGPARNFTWFIRVTMKPRYANADTLAKEDGLYGKGKSEDVPKPNARRSWATEIGEDDGYVSNVVPEIYFRDEAGKVWAKRTSDSQKVSNFMHYYERATTRPDYGNGRFPRGVDMSKIKIYIHQLIDDVERYGGVEGVPHLDPNTSKRDLIDEKLYTRVANALGWSNMRTTPAGGWDRERFAKAEWLHRCGYAYGGLSDNDASSSQVKENLIFGTSETNSVMTRYEDVYRNAILRERTLIDVLRGVYAETPTSNLPMDYVNGKLTTELTGVCRMLRSKDNTIRREEINPPKANITPEPKDWSDISKRYPWLCAGLKYVF
ncbi:uncharacterized protein DFL_003367 [Arthrobotrys flagrans]|uniref:Uncharacterized protein n=1 Tax=Arthrobotrys flagrans TaxID=97331 RepID=A0A437A1M0_ARTFL|nr:hypothetical protein DFL_003367 [Arthrobotrys flagrans]